MENLYKRMIKELDDLIERAPDVDIEQEYNYFCEQHEVVLWDLKQTVPGLLPRMLLVMDLMRFQKNFMLGDDVSQILHRILNAAKHIHKDELIKNFSCEKRMKQMAKILENKGVDILSEGLKRRKNA